MGVKVLAILQARVSSSRLPGKVLKPLLGKPMLLRQIERIQRANCIEQLIVATSVEPSDDSLEKLCIDEGFSCYRGNLNDVLDRFYQAGLFYTPEHVIRLTGDCPLADPELIDQIVEYHLNGCYDYSSNTIEPTYPDGLDVEVFRFSALQEAWREAKLPSQREHVTPYLYQHKERFRIGEFRGNIDLSMLRWTVDEPADFDLIEKIYSELYPINPAFSTENILALLERHPQWKTRNTSFSRNEGYLKSLQADFFKNQ